MKKIKELVISKNLFEEYFKKSKIKVEKLRIFDVNSENIFYYKNLDFFLDNNLLDILFDIIKNHSDKLIIEKKKEIRDAIINSNDYRRLVSYAKDILKGRWINDESLSLSKRKEIEFIIASNQDGMFNYINYVLKDRWIEYEENIAKSRSAFRYAELILKKRWIDVPDINLKVAKEAEKKILKSEQTLAAYLKLVKDRWPEFEEKMINNPNDLIKYYFNSIKMRIPNFEDFISKDAEKSFEYSENVLKKPWNKMKGIIDDKIIKQAEDTIYSNPYLSIDYSLRVSNERLPIEIENKVFNNYNPYNLYNYIKKKFNKRVPDVEKNIIKLKKLIDLDKKQFLLYIQKNFKNEYTTFFRDINPHVLDDDLADNYASPVVFEILVFIYLYIKNIIKGLWPEIGINNQDDLKKLKEEINESDSLFLHQYKGILDEDE
jgi:hypothetical protein